MFILLVHKGTADVGNAGKKKPNYDWCINCISFKMINPANYLYISCLEEPASSAFSII